MKLTDTALLIIFKKSYLASFRLTNTKGKTLLFVVLYYLILLNVNISHANNNIQFKHIPFEQDASIGAILDIHHDQHGFIWVAGRQGLSRYDGYSFEVFRHDKNDPTSIMSNNITKIREDKYGNLWITTENGLDRYDYETETFVHAEHIPGNPNSLYEGRVIDIFFEGDLLWLATLRGIVSYDPQNNLFTRYPRNEQEQALAGNWVLGLATDSDGIMYIATGYGLKVWDRKTGNIDVHKAEPGVAGRLQSNHIRSILVDSLDRIWVGSEKGIYQFDPKAKSFIHYPVASNHAFVQTKPNDASHYMAVWDIMEDSQGVIWFATDGFGIQRLAPSSDTLTGITHNPDDPFSLSSSVPRTIAEDRNGDIWIGHYPSGIDVYERYSSAFQSFSVKANDSSGMSAKNVKYIYEDEKQNLWLGIDHGGINYYDTKNNTFTHFQHDPNDSNSLGSDDVISIMVDHNDLMWISTWTTGITLFDRKKQQFTRIPTDFYDETKLQSEKVWVTFEDKNHTVWVGTLGFGIARYDRTTDTFKRYVYSEAPEEGLLSGLVWDIQEDSRGNLWIGTQIGLSKIDRETEKFTHYVYNKNETNSISSSEIRAIFEDSQNRLWIATNGGGLNQFHYDTQTFSSVSTKDGLASDMITAVVEDNNGMLWVSSSDGLSAYNPDTNTITNYNQSYGLQHKEFNTGTAAKTQNGDLIFGGINGFTRFNPDKIEPNDIPPPVVFTDISILNKPVKIGKNQFLSKSILLEDKIELSHRQNIITINFTALNFRDPTNNQYAYKLSGFDKDWHHMGNKRSATYTNLDAGTYKLTVKAANNEGYWNHKGRSIQIKVHAPPWKTWWAYVLYFIFLISVIGWYIRTQQKIISAERRAKEQLEEKVKDRTQALEEANKQLETLSYSDHLTGLGNRRLLEKMIHTEIFDSWRRGAKRNNQAPPSNNNDLIFFLIDIDYFKQVNDTYGHAAGDAVLVTMAKILKEVSRKADYVIRWGGEEFLIITRFSEEKSAPQIAERIRHHVEKTQFDIGNDIQINMTCSIGFSSYPFHLLTNNDVKWEYAIDLADKALYEVKSTGRNNWKGVDLIDLGFDSSKDLDHLVRNCKVKIIEASSLI